MFLLFIWLVMGFVCYDVAKGKGFNCNTCNTWALLGVIFGVFALMVLVMIPKKNND